jgi:hypothetical protein
VLHLQRTAGNAAVTRTLQRMFHNKGFQAPQERVSEDEEDQDWGEDEAAPQEEEEKEPTVLDLFEVEVIRYRSINEKEEYDIEDARVQGLLRFWDGSLGKVLKIASSAFTDSKSQTIDQIIARIKANGYKCHHNATESLGEIIAKMRAAQE